MRRRFPVAACHRVAEQPGEARGGAARRRRGAAAAKRRPHGGQGAGADDDEVGARENEGVAGRDVRRREERVQLQRQRSGVGN